MEEFEKDQKNSIIIYVLMIVSIIFTIFIIPNYFSNYTRSLNLVIWIIIFLRARTLANQHNRFKGLKEKLKTTFIIVFIYLIGYYLVTADRIIKRIIKLKWLLVGGWIIASVVNILLFVYIEQYELLNTICNYLAFSFGIPALFCLAHEYLDFSNSVSQSASRLSYVFYSTHFPIAILCQYLISMTGVNCILNFIISLIIAYPVTIISCWLIDKLKFLRVIFGLK